MITHAQLSKRYNQPHTVIMKQTEERSKEDMAQTFSTENGRTRKECSSKFKKITDLSAMLSRYK